jgi:hypothetical protein
MIATFRIFLMGSAKVRAPEKTGLRRLAHSSPCG